jgi:hypothetical protein
LAGLALAGALAGCNGSSHPPPTTTTTSRAPVTTTTTTVPGTQLSGPRTVLSPIGLNVRQSPSKSSKILASAAQGVTFTVKGHSPADGGWYEVQGSSANGWISANPTLSAAGTFLPFQSNHLGFAVLYPDNWLEETLPNSVVFKAPPGTAETVTFRAGPPATLPHGHAGYELTSTQTVIPCGVTTTLYVYMPVSATGPVVPQVRIPVTTKETLAIDGVLPSKAYMQSFDNFVNSVTFANPQCRV